MVGQLRAVNFASMICVAGSDRLEFLVAHDMFMLVALRKSEEPGWYILTESFYGWVAERALLHYTHEIIGK